MRKLLICLTLLFCLLQIADAEETVCLFDADATVYPTIALHAGPSGYAEVVASCYSGAQAAVLDRGSGFVQIRIGPLTGWVSQASVISPDEAHAVPLQGVVYTFGATRYQYLLETPGGQLKAALEGHVPVSLLAMTADHAWLLVQLSDGLTGYLPVEAVAPSTAVSQAFVYAEEPSLRLHLRSEPTTKSDSLGNYYCGTEVALLFAPEEYDGWTRISIAGQNGWMKTEFLAFTDAPGNYLPPLGLVQGTDATGLNLRAAPDYNASVITRYELGTAVEIMAAHGIWAHVRTQDGYAGYMLLKHLGGDPPASVPNSIPVLPVNAGAVNVRLACARPALKWQYTASGLSLSTLEACPVYTQEGALIFFPAAQLDAWSINQALPVDSQNIPSV